jgi:hypothetical protein
MKAIVLICLLLSSANCFADDHTLYYRGVVHWTDLTGKGDAPADQNILLKKEILTSRHQFIETATLVNFQNLMCDSKTVVSVSEATISSQSINSKGKVTVTGLGRIQNIAPDGDFSYLNITLTVLHSGTVVKDINYITPDNRRLIARKEIDDNQGHPNFLWESDLGLITEAEFQQFYKQSESIGVCPQ